MTNGTPSGARASSEAGMTCDDWGLDAACWSLGRKSAMFTCVIIGSGQLPDLSAHSVLAPGQPSPESPSYLLHFLTVCGQISQVWATLDGLIKKAFLFQFKKR